MSDVRWEASSSSHFEDGGVALEKRRKTVGSEL